MFLILCNRHEYPFVSVKDKHFGFQLPVAGEAKLFGHPNFVKTSRGK